MDKSPEAFRTISEVADWLGTPTHVLRFWESRFTQVKPVKRAGGRRYYRPADMALLGGIKKLLHEDGMTIRGVQKLLREEGVRHVAAMSPALDAELGEAPFADVEAEALEPADVVQLDDARAGRSATRTPEVAETRAAPADPDDVAPKDEAAETETALDPDRSDTVPSDAPPPTDAPPPPGARPPLFRAPSASSLSKAAPTSAEAPAPEPPAADRPTPQPPAADRPTAERPAPPTTEPPKPTPEHPAGGLSAAPPHVPVGTGPDESDEPAPDGEYDMPFASPETPTPRDAGPAETPADTQGDASQPDALASAASAPAEPEPADATAPARRPAAATAPPAPPPDRETVLEPDSEPEPEPTAAKPPLFTGPPLTPAPVTPAPTAPAPTTPAAPPSRISFEPPSDGGRASVDPALLDDILGALSEGARPPPAALRPLVQRMQALRDAFDRVSPDAGSG